MLGKQRGERGFIRAVTWSRQFQVAVKRNQHARLVKVGDYIIHNRFPALAEENTMELFNLHQTRRNLTAFGWEWRAISSLWLPYG